FEDPDFPDKVKKALYGLHQAPRAWYETLSTYLLDNGFHKGKIDKTLFIRRYKDDILLVQVYVDDIIFARVESSDDESLDEKDASKQERIMDDLDADEDITLVNDQEMFDIDKDLQGEEVVVEQEVIANKDPIVDPA
nr:putative ribonuclease H-like domain-containing protein [Tanacetum cinerariifolium]